MLNPELLQLKGHTGPIRGVAVTPDGTRIVTGSTDNTAWVWDASTGAKLLQLKGHTGPISNVTVTTDGTRVVTGSDDNTARVWDASTGAELLQLRGHTRPILGVAVTPDGTRIVTGSTDNTAWVWDASTGAKLLQLKGHTGPISSATVTPDGTRIVTASTDNTLRVLDASTGSELLQLKGHTGPISSATVTPDGTRIVTESEQLEPKVHTGPFSGVAVTPDGTRIVTASTDKTARVWSLAQLRPSPPRQEVQALIDYGKAVAPRCLTIRQRQDLLLSPKPPDWCIETGKYFYDNKLWKASKPDTTPDATTIAEAYGDFADAAIRAGDFKIALEAAELSIKFGPEIIWVTMNRTHALMFLGRTEEARKGYLERNKRWEDVVLGDF
jgi:hypothetical protein